MRPQRSSSGSPHSGQASPVSSPFLTLRMSFFAAARSRLNGP